MVDTEIRLIIFFAAKMEKLYMGLIPGLGRSPGGGHSNPLQNPTDREAWQATVHRVPKGWI